MTMPRAVVEELQRQLVEMRRKGMGTDKIAEALNLSPDTVIWLMTHMDERRRTRKPVADTLVDWATIGANRERLILLGKMMSSLVREKLDAGTIDAVCGLAVNGVPIAQEVARDLGKPCVIAKTSGPIEFISPFFDLFNKRIILVDHVITTGRTLARVIDKLKETDTHPVGIFIFVDKRPWKDATGQVEGVSSHCLLRAIKP